MRLTDAQVAEYEECGYLVFPGLVSRDEVEILRRDLHRVTGVEAEGVIREKSGAVRSVFRVHDETSPTASPPFQALATLPRVIDPARQVLGDEPVYVYHTKCNLKDAIDGAIWQWHQDYGYWKTDGVDRPDMTTSLLMLDEATEIGGCLYFIPGSHKLGRLDPEMDETTTSYKLWTVPKDQVIEIMTRFGDPVPITGKPGTVVLFHPNIVHGSGHNMSRHARWHIYTVYNQVSNRPHGIENPRPEWVVARRCDALETGSDDGILRLADANADAETRRPAAE